VSLVAAIALPEARDVVVGRWISEKRLGDGAVYGFELKPGGAASAINTSTMRVERWRRIDATHIELTEVSEGNRTITREKVRYRVSFARDGAMTLTPDGAARAMYVGVFRSDRPR
jgi:hypothetical protein